MLSRLRGWYTDWRCRRVPAGITVNPGTTVIGLGPVEYRARFTFADAVPPLERIERLERRVAALERAASKSDGA